jgi:hypothetical protein
MRRLGPVAVLIAVLASCNGKGTRRREDAEVPGSRLETRWIETLKGAARVTTGGGAIFASWQAFSADDPAPDLIEVLDAEKGALVASGRGWLLRAGEPEAALIVQEKDAALAYVVQRLDGSGEVVLAAPDDKAWPLRGVACGARVELCAVVRWSATPGTVVAKGALERVSIAVVNAGTLAVERTIEHEAASYLGGSGRVGGVSANPARPEIYLLERGGAPGELKVRAVDLASGKTSWHVTVAALSQDPIPQDDAELIVTGDGKHVAVAQGNVRWSYLEMERLTLLDSATGAVAHTLDEPSGYGFVASVPERPPLLVVRIGAAKHGGETPDYAFLGVTQVDPSSGRTDELIGRSDGDAPQGGVALDAGTLLLYKRGIRQPYVEDPSPPDRQQARAAAVGAMLDR